MRTVAGSFTISATFTPPGSCPGAALTSNTTCLARSGWPSGPVTLSALAMLLALTFMRCDWAESAEPAISKMLSMDMRVILEVPTSSPSPDHQVRSSRFDIAHCYRRSWYVHGPYRPCCRPSTVDRECGTSGQDPRQHE